MPTLRTVTVKPSAGDYTSLAGAEAGETHDIVAIDRQLDIACYAMNDTTQAAFAGWTTDATRYVRVYTPSTERHAGTWDTSKYRLSVTGDTCLLVTSGTYVRVEGLQVHCTETAATVKACLFNAGQSRFSQTICRGSYGTGTSGGYGIYQDGSGATVRAWNCLIYDISGWTSGFGAGCSHQTGTAAYFSNITVQGCAFGFGTVAAGTVLKNCLAQDCSDGTFDSFGSPFEAASTNNTADVGTPPGSNPQTGEVTFADEAGDDFHLSASDTVAKGLGTDLSGDANTPFSDDIDGQTRGATWDIGADQITGVTVAQPVTMLTFLQ
jgi:hypothetical protein